MRFYKLLLMVPVVMMGVATTNVMAACSLDASCKERSDDNLYPSGAKGCYECDNDHCVGGTVLTAYKPQLDGKQYRDGHGWYSFSCETGAGLANDRWVEVTLDDCTDTLHTRLKGKQNTKRVPYNPEAGGASKNNNESHVYIGEQVCLAWVCMDDYEEVDGECVPKGSKKKPTPTPNPDPKPKPDPSPKLTCRQQRANGTPTGLACCDTDEDADYNKATDQCVCKDTSKEFKIDVNGRGRCVAKGTPEQPVNPCGTMCETYVDITIVNNNCNTQRTNLQSIKTQVKQQCDQDTKCDAKKVSKLVTQMQQLVVECDAKPQLNEQRLAAAVEAIDKYRSGLDVSVWKDAEGNFNTARLVSDSIAGVVLGTAGGLITSSVVKKNQVKNGFEDVVCTIGGQTVGSYGDEISVGIQ